MKGYNVIAVYNKACDRLLMCRRRKDPYKGLLNLVGGKIDPNEDGYCAAYRELCEETGITENDIILTRLMSFHYHMDDSFVEVYAGRLNKNLEVRGDENELLWVTLDKDFFDMKEFAGEGNIGHMLEHVKMWKDKVLNIEN